MNDYQQQQWDALHLARSVLKRLGGRQREMLASELLAYLQFRQEVDAFQQTHFSTRCTANCYQNRRSACCSKDGIITFWADVVINLLCSDTHETIALEQALRDPAYSYKCTYLTRNGCCWRVRPLVCAMFLCDEVQLAVFGEGDSESRHRWHILTERAKTFRWPDRLVLFDRLETFFLERGHRSPLMYINTSPGLMRIKRLAGVPISTQATQID